MTSIEPNLNARTNQFIVTYDVSEMTPEFKKRLPEAIPKWISQVRYIDSTDSEIRIAVNSGSVEAVTQEFNMLGDLYQELDGRPFSVESVHPNKDLIGLVMEQMDKKLTTIDVDAIEFVNKP